MTDRAISAAQFVTSQGRDYVLELCLRVEVQEIHESHEAVVVMGKELDHNSPRVSRST